MEDTRLIRREIERRRAEGRGPLDAVAVRSGRYGAFGVAWDMRSDDAAVYRMMLERMPPGATPAAGKAPVRSYAVCSLPPTLAESTASHVLLCDGRPLLRSSETSDLADAFEENLKCLVAERSPRRVFLRAGVVGWRDRAIVIAGGPGTGKRTLVRALVARGATYLSDDYAVLDGGTVEAYPSRRYSPVEPAHPLSHWLDDEGIDRPLAPVPVGLVLFAPYQAGAVFKPKLLPRGRSLLELFKHAVAAQRNPMQVLRALETLSRRSSALEGVRGDARAVATYLLDRLV